MQLNGTLIFSVISSCTVLSCNILFFLDLLFQDESHEFLPLNGNSFTIFVRGSTEHGVVGLQGALITCFSCDHQVHTCEHVTKILESEEGMEHEMPDFLVDFSLREIIGNPL